MTSFSSGQIAEFNNRLLAVESVSALLGQWCGAPVRALKEAIDARHLDEADRQRLDPEPHELIDYRSVRLASAAAVLSHAEIWYRRHCLTPDMLTALRETDTPFGLVVRPLGQYRKAYGITELPRPFILEHRAVLMTRTGTPFGIVHERYTEAALALAQSR